MAEIQTSGGSRTNVELNLVPFIDLMSVLITFLLITAVWTQESMIQIGSSVYGKKTDEVPQPTPETEVALRVDVDMKGYRFLLAKQVVILPLKDDGGFDDESLLGLIQKAKIEYPQKVDAAISVADGLTYDRLIHVMDAFLKGGFDRLSVLTEGSN